MTDGPHRSRPIRTPPPDEPMPMTTARDRPPEEAAEDTSFARGLRVLLTIADRGEIRADDLGTALDMSMSTVYRYLRTLTEFGFVERHDGGYGLGPRLLIGTGANVSSEELIRRRRPVPAAARRGDRRDRRHQPPHRPGRGLPARDPVRPRAARDAGRRPQRPARPGGARPARCSPTRRPEVFDEVVGRRHRPAARAGRRPPAARRPPRDRRRRHRAECRRVHLRLGGHRRSHHPGRRDRRPRSASSDPESRCGLAWRARVGRVVPDAARVDRRGARRSRSRPDPGMRLSYVGSGTSRYLTIDAPSADAAPAMDILRDLAPVSDAYASLPVAEAFDWSVAGGDLGTGEWYMVAFRSIRRDRRRRGAAVDVRRARPPGGRHGARLRPLLQGPDGPGRLLPVVLPLGQPRRRAEPRPAGRRTSRPSACSTRCTSRTRSSSSASGASTTARRSSSSLDAAPPAHGRPAVDGGLLPEFQPGALPS